MRALSALDLIHVWEQGLSLAPVAQPLELLAAACPGVAREDLAALSMGRRDALLLRLREQTLGRTLRILVECSRCQDPLEFTLSSESLCHGPAPQDPAPGEGNSLQRFSADAWHLEFRPPNSQDLAAASICSNASSARRVLLERCVVQARHGETPVTSQDFPPDVIAALEARIAALDPPEEILLNLHCPRCETCWQLPFDIGRFFWEEINALAKRLLLEVHTLARAYGWREVDILSMSAARRQFYLEMVS